MCGEFAAGIYAVVTARAVASNTSVVKLRRAPGAGGVARVTGLCSGDMRRMLARGLGAVVAGGASARNHTGVVETGGLPSRRGMAGIALLHGDNVRGVLARGNSAVVAGATAASDALMAELRWRPAGRAMAQFAALRRR